MIRDALGTGLGAKPICNTDVFCVAPPDLPPRDLPAGVLHPKRVLKGVVAGVRDYGNRMGIPTVNGALAVDAGYLANPLVFCGTVGVLPRGKAFKKVRAGDRIVAIGGQTGRDGIHIGAGLGALMGKFAKTSIDQQFQNQVRNMVQPGTSALFLMLEKVTPDKAVAAMSKYGGTVSKKTSLSKDDEKELQDALHGGPRPPNSPTLPVSCQCDPAASRSAAWSTATP